MLTENLSKVIVSLNLKRYVYTDNVFPVIMYHAPIPFNEETVSGVDGWLENPKANETKWLGLTDTICKVRHNNITDEYRWLDFEVPVKDWINILNGDRKYNGFVFHIKQTHCTYQEYHSKECNDKSKAPKLQLIYDESVPNSSEKSYLFKSIIDFSENILNISTPNLHANKYEGYLTICDLRGRTISSTTLGLLKAGKNCFDIKNQTRDLAQGAYIISVTISDEKIAARYVKH